jgi:hypothetical protein
MKAAPADIFQAVTVAPGPRPAGQSAIFQAPTVAPRPRDATTLRPRAVKATPVPTKRSRPVAKPWWKKRWLVAVLAIIGLFIGIIVLVDGIAAFHDWRETSQRNEELRRISKDNFLKLKVGMTLKELEDILGVGEPAKPEYGVISDPAWNKAAKEYRVYHWSVSGSTFTRSILAGFSEHPSADTKVEALRYRDGSWDEDKGVLSGAKE